MSDLEIGICVGLAIACLGILALVIAARFCIANPLEQERVDAEDYGA